MKKAPKQQQLRLALASLDQSSGSGSKAQQNYEKVLGTNPNNVIALNNLAWVYHDAGDPRSLKLAQRAYELAPRIPAIADTYGWFLVSDGKMEQGLSILERAARGAPDHAEIQYHLAVALVEAGDRRRARSILDRVLKDGSDFPARAEAERLHKAL